MLWNGFSFDFNSILVNETYKNIHTIYLTVVDIILYLSLVFLARKCLRNILGGMDDSIDYANDIEPETDNYKRNKIGF